MAVTHKLLEDLGRVETQPLCLVHRFLHVRGRQLAECLGGQLDVLCVAKVSIGLKE